VYVAEVWVDPVQAEEYKKAVSRAVCAGDGVTVGQHTVAALGENKSWGLVYGHHLLARPSFTGS